MICPVEIANEMSAFGGVRWELFVEAHEALLTSRSGADHEDTRSDHAGDGQEDKVVSSGPHPGHQLSANETNEGALGGTRV